MKKQNFNCKICGKFCKNIISLGTHVFKAHDILAKNYYDKYMKKENEDICQNINCNNECTFLSLGKGYRKHCSNKCSQNNNEVREKLKQTCLDRYGYASALGCKKSQNKRKKKLIEKYGVPYVPMTDDIMAKIKRTQMERYGVDCVLKLKDIKDKALIKYKENLPEVIRKKKQTCLEKYGVEDSSCLPEVIRKREQTMLRRYGVKYFTQALEYKEKILNEHNGIWPISSKETREKIKKTMKERYGVEYTLQNDEFKEKVKQTNLKKYGVKCALQADIVKKKIEETNLKKYGVKCINSVFSIKRKQAITYSINKKSIITNCSWCNKDMTVARSRFDKSLTKHFFDTIDCWTNWKKEQPRKGKKLDLSLIKSNVNI